jgi:hypothetical protein
MLHNFIKVLHNSHLSHFKLKPQNLVPQGGKAQNDTVRFVNLTKAEIMLVYFGNKCN